MKTFVFIPSPENYMSVNVLDWHLSSPVNLHQTENAKNVRV